MKSPHMPREEAHRSPVGVGVITIITVLLVLCLTIFSTLTMTSARADWKLSQINAETVAAYYRADAEAAALAAGFASGDGRELEETIPMTDTQALYIHLVREADGQVRALAWQTVVNPEDGGGAAPEEDNLPVWDGTFPE